jgi:GT2 family glycosyltransferase
LFIDDANHVTKEWGAANSRVFDALAAGCLVITNSESVSSEVFGGELPVYRSSADLVRLLSFYVDEPDSRTKLVDRLRSRVLAQHCYALRALELRAHLVPYLSRGRAGLGTNGRLATRDRAQDRSSLPGLKSSPSEVAPMPLMTPAKAPFVSFVVPLYNHLEQTQAMLESLRASLPADLDYEVILVDDASTDGTREWLRQLNVPGVHTIINPLNMGYARANNAGVALARGELLGLLNNDLLFAPGWLEPMLDILLSPELNAGLVGNVQVRVADGALNHAGIQLNANAQFGHVQTLPDEAPLYRKVMAVTGACMLLRKADFAALGGFDEHFVNGCENVDLCFKVRAAGQAIYVANRSRIRHHVSLSRAASTLRDQRNSQYLFARWRPTIKQALSSLWANLLQAGPQAYAGQLSGQLAPAFLATPQAAARVIAEAMLRREETRWARDLGAADPHAEMAGRCSSRGLRYTPSLNGYALGPSVEFSIAGLSGARNFYVCGRALSDLSKQPMAMTITVNGIQAQTCKLTAGRSINAGIIDPLLLPGLTNRFRIEAHFIDAQGQRLGDASAAIVITHIVVDDRRVSEL